MHELFSRERLLHEMRHINVDEERSIDEALEDSEALDKWINEKAKGKNYDPARRQPIPRQVSQNSPLFENTMFTDYTNKTDASSLSSLNIPQASRASLTFNGSTPRMAHARKTKTGEFTPKEIVRRNLCASVARSQMKTPRDSMGPFKPKEFITPIRSARKKPSMIPQFKPAIDDSVIDLVTSSNDEQENIPNVQADARDQTLTANNNLVDQGVLAPSTQPNDVPATQQNDSIVVPETQEDNTIVPETQKSYTIVPETQDDDNDVAATQNNVSPHPVQAQVTKQNKNKQAEPQVTPSNQSLRSRIQARPPIRQNTPLTPNRLYVPSPLAIERPTPKTPSRLPVSTSRTPKPIQSTAPTAAQSHVADVMTPNAQSKAATPKIIIVPTSSNPQLSPAAVPTPAATNATTTPNMVINVNVSNSMPQSPKQAPPQNVPTNDKSVRNAATFTATTGNDSNKEGSTNESLMTNDEDSDERLANRCQTPTDGNYFQQSETYDAMKHSIKVRSMIEHEPL